MFSGLSAFPLTPMSGDEIDEFAFESLVQRLVSARVDSICALGSTGCYAYLTRTERALLSRLAVEHANGTPVIIGIGATSTREVLRLAEDAQKAGASGVLLAPVSYQVLNDKEVYGLYEAVTRELSVPLCVYDNPSTTRFVFSDELHGRIAHLPNVHSIKIPGVPRELSEAKERVANLRSMIPSHVTIGVSGDAYGALGLAAGCDAWYSVIGGTFPRIAMAITRAVQLGNTEEATKLSEKLKPLWALFEKCGGSLRVVAAAAELRGLVGQPCLPSPLLSVEGPERLQLSALFDDLGLE